MPHFVSIILTACQKGGEASAALINVWACSTRIDSIRCSGILLESVRSSASTEESSDGKGGPVDRDRARSWGNSGKSCLVQTCSKRIQLPRLSDTRVLQRFNYKLVMTVYGNIWPLVQGSRRVMIRSGRVVKNHGMNVINLERMTCSITPSPCMLVLIRLRMLQTRRENLGNGATLVSWSFKGSR